MGTRSADLAAVAREARRRRTPPLARRSRALLALLAIASLLASTAVPAQEPRPEPLAQFPSAEITLDAHGTVQHFHVHIAATETRRNQGLMYVKSLPTHEGMLFLFDAPQSATFWMKNCLISLDIMFVGADGRIIRIAENAVPGSEATISSMGKVRGVLELGSGAARRFGIQPGDRIHHPAFETH